jgi:hypothetical protein
MRLENECEADRVDQFYAALHESAYGPKRTWPNDQLKSAFGGKADIHCPHSRPFRCATLSRYHVFRPQPRLSRTGLAACGGEEQDHAAE